MLEENKSYEQIDKLIEEEMHDNFILNELFWTNHVKRKLNEPHLDEKHINFAMLALEDDISFSIVKLIVEKISEKMFDGRLRNNFVISIFEKMITLFDWKNDIGSYLYK
jgi:hypothetical protein